MAVEILERWKKKGSKNSPFFLNGLALYPLPPLLMARSLREELFLRLPLHRCIYILTYIQGLEFKYIANMKITLESFVAKIIYDLMLIVLILL